LRIAWRGINATMQNLKSTVILPIWSEECRSSRSANRDTVRAVGRNQQTGESQIHCPPKVRSHCERTGVVVAMCDSHGYSGDSPECQDKPAEMVNMAVNHVEGAISLNQ
jgi:hypothetical protein